MMNTDIWLAGGVAIAGGALAIWRMSKDAKKMGKSFDKYLRWKFIDQKNGWILLAVIMINTAEALLSATLHPEAGQQVNIISRFVMHMAISLVAIIMMINLPTEIIKALEVTPYLWELKGKGKSDKIRTRRFVNILLVLVEYLSVLAYLLAALILPYLNLNVIATGFGESMLAEAAFRNLLRFVIKILTLGIGGGGQELIVGPDGIPTNPVNLMTMAMKSSWFLVLCHYIMTFTEGITSLKDYLRDQRDILAGRKRKSTKRKHEKSDAYDENDMSEEDYEDLADDISAIKDKLFGMLSLLYKADNKSTIVKRQGTMLLNAFSNKFDDEQQVDVTVELVSYYKLWKAFGKNTGKGKRSKDSDKIHDEYVDLVAETMEWIKRDPSDGGFGKTIKAPKEIEDELGE